MDLEEYFENKMEWSGSGLRMVTWSGDGAKIWQHEDLYRTDTAYTLLYRCVDAMAEAPSPHTWKQLPAALRAAVATDNEAYRRERHGRGVIAPLARTRDV